MVISLVLEGGFYQPSSKYYRWQRTIPLRLPHHNSNERKTWERVQTGSYTQSHLTRPKAASTSLSMSPKGFPTSTGFSYLDKTSLLMMPLHTTILFKSSFSGSTFYHHPLAPNSLNVSSICLHPSAEIVPSTSSKSSNSASPFLPYPILIPPVSNASLPFSHASPLWPSSWAQVWISHCSRYTLASLRTLNLLCLLNWHHQLLPLKFSSSDPQVPPRKPDKMQIPGSHQSF